MRAHLYCKNSTMEMKVNIKSRTLGRTLSLFTKFSIDRFANVIEVSKLYFLAKRIYFSFWLIPSHFG